MSVFRPAVRVTDPHGRQWELYAFKLKLGRREPDGPDLLDPLTPGTWGAGAGELALAGLVLGAVTWLLLLVPRLLLFLLWDLPRAGLRAHRSDEWTIEAIAWLPGETRYAWTTTGEFRRNVLAQVEGQLARGEIPPRPTRATYLGAS